MGRLHIDFPTKKDSCWGVHPYGMFDARVPSELDGINVMQVREGHCVMTPSLEQQPGADASPCHLSHSDDCSVFRG